MTRLQPLAPTALSKFTPNSDYTWFQFVRPYHRELIGYRWRALVQLFRFTVRFLNSGVPGPLAEIGHVAALVVRVRDVLFPRLLLRRLEVVRDVLLCGLRGAGGVSLFGRVCVDPDRARVFLSLGLARPACVQQREDRGGRIRRFCSVEWRFSVLFQSYGRSAHCSGRSSTRRGRVADGPCRPTGKVRPGADRSCRRYPFG